MAKLCGMAARLQADKFRKIMDNEDYAFFTSGDFNLNIISVRSKSGSADSFDDMMVLLYKEDGEWVSHIYEMTTEPGPSILKNPINEKGTAILCPGQYRGVYKIDTHGGKNRYTALCQRNGTVKVWRDDNRDTTPDYIGPEDEGFYGINIHKHSGPDDREYAGGASAGCQVFRSSKDFYEFMDICDIAADAYGNSFTYTLIDEETYEWEYSE